MSKFESAYWAAVHEDFYVFLQQAFHTVYPRKGFYPNWHINAICHALEDARRGTCPRLIINLPPRHLKSFIVSVCWPAFLLGHDPTMKIICISYSDELAATLARDFKQIVVESDWYRALFPNVRLTKVTANEVVTDQGGFRFATSVGGTLTGRGADAILIDDPIKPQDALSDSARNNVNNWFRSTLLSRLDDKERSILAIVMQRLHVNDLTGFAESSGGFRKLSFPAIAVCGEEVPLLHGAFHRRYPGEPLQADREGLKLLNSMREQVGVGHFNSQYQQAPDAPEGNMFKRGWFDIVDKMPKRGSTGHWYLSIDSAQSTSETADYSAISLVWAERGQFYVYRSQRGRWDYEELKNRALRYYETFNRQLSFVVEAASSGISLAQYLLSNGKPCFYYTPRQDKVHRAAIAIPLFAEKRVHLVRVPGRDQWIDGYINEFMSFPHGRFDDQVDSLVQLLPFANGRHRADTGGYYALD
jgi:predicted phage terminase large subunit-like protein